MAKVDIVQDMMSKYQSKDIVAYVSAELKRLIADEDTQVRDFKFVSEVVSALKEKMGSTKPINVL